MMHPPMIYLFLTTAACISQLVIPTSSDPLLFSRIDDEDAPSLQAEVAVMKHELPHDHTDWIKDARNGFYYSTEAGLHFDTETGEFFDSEFNLWFDLAAEQWYPPPRRGQRGAPSASPSESHNTQTEFVAPKSKSASISKSMTDSEEGDTAPRLRDLPHDHDDWAIDERNGFYFSESAGLYFDRHGGKFYDPLNKHWYDPDTEKWTIESEDL